MVGKNLVTSFVRGWNFTRGETLEILNSLTDAKLKFKPGNPSIKVAQDNRFQTLAYQFACIGRTQLVYTKAIQTGWMDFSLFSSPEMPSKVDFKTKGELLKFLGKTDKEWIEMVRSRREQEDFEVKWPGFNKSLVNHIASLAEHERIHHGQIISYFSLAGFELPEAFKRNWAL